MARAKGQVREGFRYVWRTPSLRNTLLAIALIGIFAYNFTVTLAVLAKVTFHGGAGAYSLLTSCMGFGAVVGGLLAAHRARPTPRLLQVLALVFGGLLAAVALAPTLLTASILIVFMGAASIGFIATANATLQLSSTPAMRGRVMALYAMAFLGTTPDRRAPGRCHRPVGQSPGRPADRGGGHGAGRRVADVAPPGRPPAGRRRPLGRGPRSRGGGGQGRRVQRGLRAARPLRGQPAEAVLGQRSRSRSGTIDTRARTSGA